MLYRGFERLCLELRALNVTVPMHRLHRHLTIRVDEFACNDDDDADRAAAVSARPDLPLMDVKSDRGDLHVYLAECEALARDDYSAIEIGGPTFDEAAYRSASSKPPSLRPRGARRGDKLGQLPARRAEELAAVQRRIALTERRTWATLRRSYSFAEQHATRSFKTTVIFEPWGGKFVVARRGALRFGWTNSQPLDLLDGYDLLTPEGEALLFKVLEEQDPFLTIIAFDCLIWSCISNMNPHIDWDQIRKTVGLRALRLVRRICLHRYHRGRYFLVEQPANAASWTYEGILAEIYFLVGVFFAHGCQCPFGQRDPDSGKLVKKMTGYLTNSQVILNAVALPCACEPGSHERLLSTNSHGRRSRQAAEYTGRMGDVICDAALRQMELDAVFELSVGGDAGDDDPEDAYVTQTKFIKRPLGQGLSKSSSRPPRARRTRAGGWEPLQDDRAAALNDIFGNFDEFTSLLKSESRSGTSGDTTTIYEHIGEASFRR